LRAFLPLAFQDHGYESRSSFSPPDDFRAEFLKLYVDPKYTVRRFFLIDIAIF